MAHTEMNTVEEARNQEQSHPNADQKYLDVARRRYIKSLNTAKTPSMDAVDKLITVVMLEHTGMNSVPDLSIFRNAQKLYLHENNI